MLIKQYLKRLAEVDDETTLINAGIEAILHDIMIDIGILDEEKVLSEHILTDRNWSWYENLRRFIDNCTLPDD